MSYRLEAEESLPAGIRRIATEQIDQALDDLTHLKPDPDEAVHDARKCFKKVRAVLRLVRDEIGEDVYQRENACYRDAGRALAPMRDSVVMVETLDDLRDHFAGQLALGRFKGAYENLAQAHQDAHQRILEEQNVPQEVITTIQAARKRVTDWPIEHDDFPALRGGLKRVYKRGRKRMNEAYAQPTPEGFHEWRKRVKYLWYHVRILQPLWPDMLDELADNLHDVADYLGLDHDLAELQRTVLEDPEMFEDRHELELLIALIERRRAELEAAARPLAQRIYFEKPGAFANRMEAYWDAWQHEMDDRLLAGQVEA